MFLSQRFDCYGAVAGLVYALFYLPLSGASIIIDSKPANPTKIVQGTQNFALSWHWNISAGTTIFGGGQATIKHKGADIGALARGTPNSVFLESQYTARYDISIATFNPVTLIIKNVQPQDAGEYAMSLRALTNGQSVTTEEDSKFILDVLVPANISTANPAVTENKTDSVTLECSPTGNPAPNVTWTRNGIEVGSGNTHTISSVARADAGCYVCAADNGVGSGANASVCLDVQYKPEPNATLTADRSVVCKKDSVTLTCAAGPAHPAVTSYDFYRGDVLLGNSASNVYVSAAPVGLPDYNVYTCVPRNLVGGGANASVQVSAKVPPSITSFSPAQTVIEGSTVMLQCNASGTAPLNTTITKVGGSQITNTGSHTFSAISRNDEGSYSCMVHNGGECPTASQTTIITVNYKPESCVLTTNTSSHTYVKGDHVMFTCSAQSKPQQCNASLYHHGNELVSNHDQTCSGLVTSHMVSNIQGCNAETYSCRVSNTAGQCETAINVTVNDPPSITVTSTTPSGETSSPSITLNEGDMLTLNCTATGCPTPNITWSKQGTPASLASMISHEVEHQLTLQKSHSGQYICMADNGVGNQVSRIVTVVVNYKPYNTQLTSTKNDACVNNSITLNCTSDALPSAHEYLFYRNDIFLQSSASGLLQFNAAQAGSNVYMCVPNNTVGTGVNKTVQINTKATPVITFVTSNETVIEGSGLTLECNATGTEPLNLTWTKVGASTIVSSSRTHHFSSISRGDEGTYLCTVHNGVECPAAAAMVTVIVNYKPESTSITSSESVACLNDTVTLTCTATANPSSVHYKFYRNDEMIHTCNTGIHTLKLSTPGVNSYTCVPNNTVGIGPNSSVTVTVKDPPQITESPTTINVTEGSSANLTCRASGAPPLTITWSRLGSNFTYQGAVLSFSSVSRLNDSTYQCRVHNGAHCEATSATASINVHYAPSIVTAPTSAKANANDGLILYCSATGHPKPTIHWTKAGNNTIIAVGETLSIVATESASGTYICTASNGVAPDATANATVQVRSNCQADSCANGATCVSTGNGTRCQCPVGMTGDKCDEQDSSESVIEIQLKITSKTFSDELLDENSQAYKDLEAEVRSPFQTLFPEAEIDITFTEGSVIANVKMTFNSSVLVSTVKSTIKTQISNGKLGTLTVDPTSLKVGGVAPPCRSSPCKYDSTCTTSGSGYKCECSTFRYGTHCENGVGVTPGIVIIVACGALILVCLILCVWFCCSKRKQSYPKDLEQEGTRMRDIDHPRAAVNEVSNQTSNGSHPVPKVNVSGAETYKPISGKEGDTIYAHLSFENNKSKDDESTLTAPHENTTYAELKDFQTFKGSANNANTDAPLNAEDSGVSTDHAQSHDNHVTDDIEHAQKNTDHVPDDTDGPVTGELYPKKVDLYDIN